MSNEFDYLNLPSPTQLRSMVGTLLDRYSKRDRLIMRMRQALEGKNAIKVPKSVQFKAVPAHTYRLNAIFNEKASRYKDNPEVKIIPIGRAGKVSKTNRDDGEEIEKGTNAAIYQIDVQGSERVWPRITWDLHVADAAVEKWVRAPNAWWPKLIPYKIDPDDPESPDTNDLLMAYSDPKLYEKAKEEYKRGCGIPITRMHVPIERFYPVFEGPMLIEGFEFSERSLRSVMNNKLFDTSVLAGYGPGADGGLSQQVVIMEYSNPVWHAYYALGPASYGGNTEWPQITQTKSLSMGQPILLHAYKHGLGEPVYNYYIGRGGGWLSNNSWMEGVMEALLDLNQQADELNSQLATLIRNTSWPTRAVFYDKEARAADEGPPKAPAIQEGEMIALFSTEKIENIMQSLPDYRLAEWQYEQVVQRMNELAGSPALFGERSPGVSTGYHQQLQLTQAEHLDSQLEAALSRGVIQGIQKMFKHIRAMNEKVYVFASEKNQSSGQYICIDPTKLDPIPQLGAKVRDPRPTDLLSAAQTFIQLTSIRPGHNTPAVPDNWAREELLGIHNPEDMERDIMEQGFREAVSNPATNPLIVQEIMQRLGMELAKRQQSALTPGDVSGSSPAFQQAVSMMNGPGGEAPMMGGVSPGSANAQVEAKSGAGGLLKGVGGGLAPGAPQPAQTYGRGRQIMRGM